VPFNRSACHLLRDDALPDGKVGAVLKCEHLIHVGDGLAGSVYRLPVPLYFFDVYNDDVTLDDEGAELADEHAACAHAIKEARVLAADTVLHGHFTGSHRIEIRDANHNIIDQVLFGEAVELRT
jgi:hypothetical protein